MGEYLPFTHALRRVSLRVSVVIGPVVALGLALAAGAAPSGAASPRPGPTAVAARTLSLNVNSSMELVGRPGHVLNHRGTVSGTLNGHESASSVALSTTQGTSKFTLYTKSGSMFGRASSHGHVEGSTLYFSGTATITGGTGTWAHASGSGLRFSGVLDRQNFHITDHLNGSISY
jgi:hypothetical protein